MPTTAAKPTKQSPPATVEKQLDSMIAEAVTKWREWATVAADGGTLPPAAELFNVAAMLGIRDAGAALSADAETIRNVRVAEIRLDLARRHYDEKLAADGGLDAIRRQLNEHRAEIRRLEAVIGAGASMAIGGMMGELTGLKSRAPRLFAKRYAGEGIR